jgi:predicted XRE-type DNA-binding protein
MKRTRKETNKTTTIGRSVIRSLKEIRGWQRGKRGERLVRGSSSVFVGYPDAEERQTKLRLAHAINKIIDGRRLTQVAAAGRLNISQPKVSALRNYKLDGFSVERLMTFLTALDRDVEIIIRRKPRSRTTARISVVAA